MSDLTPDETRRLAGRLEAQLLGTHRASSTEDVLERLLAVQAQDPRGARLAVRSRSTVADGSDVDGALSGRRSAVISWLNRGTLHLVAAADYWWLHPLTTPQVVQGNDRRLRQLGVGRREADRGVDVIVGTITDEGPRTRQELRGALDGAGVRTEGQALVHLLAAATLRGHIVRGPVHGGQSAFVAVRDWLGPPPDPLDEPVALARLARRYLAGHGPASADDLAKWAGITLGRARAGLRAIDGECVAEPGGLVDLAARPGRRSARPGSGGRRPPSPRWPPPRLLGAFDPVLHGWVDRSLVAGAHKGVVTTNGVFRPTALVGGRVAGTWTLAAGRLRLRLLEPVGPTAERALRREGRAVLTFLGLPPTPLLVEPV